MNTARRAYILIAWDPKTSGFPPRTQVRAYWADRPRNDFQPMAQGQSRSQVRYAIALAYPDAIEQEAPKQLAPKPQHRTRRMEALDRGY